LTWVISIFHGSRYGSSMNGLTAEQFKDIRILTRFIRIYCHAKHDVKTGGEALLPEELQPRRGRCIICSDCMALLEHGIRKRSLCPLNPKPTCRKCHIHCYRPEYRQKIREIMSFSGRKLLLRGRIDYLWHYFFN